ncbi:MAG: bifunctional DNA-formamidopyrimidine glycosylase/DNA-(apurinic or apyrimidinic site) lyase [Chloroflexi bacterium]|nr:MAG: bifunctional DNA-formamidopyrimidine glycosylase/DNA-(apurinic or apyrimidinic site) lyase [Chloroflexota bacterium]
MPELPEVETIANNLRGGSKDDPPVIGRTIIGAELYWARTLSVPSPGEFFKRILGQTIVDVRRRGKFLIIKLSRDFLLIHLRMSGDIFIDMEDEPVRPHDRLLLYLDGGIRLAFNDTRKFGRVWLVSESEDVLAGLGPEPFDPNLTPEVFFQDLQTHRRQLKPLLLDQTFLAGIGNIYADESLHRAQLHPLQLSNNLSFEQAERLLESIREVLRLGIKEGGATIDWVYRGGRFQENFQVYDREGEFCRRCGTIITRIIVGQRSTHFCPECQELH